MNQEIIKNNEEVVEDTPPNSTIIEQHITDSVVANFLHLTGGQEELLTILEEHDPGFIKRLANNIEKRESELSKRREKFGAFSAYSTLTSGLFIQILTGIVCISLVIYFVISNPSSYLSVILILCGLIVSLSKTHTISKLLDILNKLIRPKKNE